MVLLAAACVALGACTGDLDPPWQLDHDRIVAVRATPPAIPAGGRSTLDALVALAGSRTFVAAPEAAIVVSPQSLADTLAFEGGAWVVTSPDEARLAAARAELGLEAADPVPLQVGVAYGGGTLAATKVVRLGMTADNPTLTAMMVDGAPADGASELVVGTLIDVPLSIEAGVDDNVNWLTSCGTMHDFDLPQAYLRVEAEDPTEGELAVVRRDPAGGVAWRVWSIRAE